jgi:hypothetical protein
MKKTILTLAAALLLPGALAAGEIRPGSVPGSLNYQGRLERDNAPVTGPVHLYFRVFNSPTANNTSGGECGQAFQPCLWQSPEVEVQATQGIFSAGITPPFTVLAGGQTLYLEVQVESDTLSPREPLNSVAYAMIAKKLEDGTDVSVATFTAAYTVNLATAAGAYMTVGTNAQSSSALLTVNGWVKMAAGGIIFPDNTSMNTSGVGSASNIANVSDADILADSDSNGAGDVLLRKPSQQFIRITNSGLVGIGNNFTADGGLAPPKGLLDVDGSLYVGDEGIYDRDDSTVNVRTQLAVDSGVIFGRNDERLQIGVTNNVISLVSGGSERARVHTNGYFGVGTSAPAVMLHSNENIAANYGVRAGSVSTGGYSPWGSLYNEVRSQTGTHLLLQQTNSYNVGIGTNTPQEKLHVRGSVLSDYGVIAATASFSGNVRVAGTFTADSKQGNTVELSSTTVNGWLIVTGGIGSQAGLPAYIASTQTFSGQNTFLNQVVASSDVFTTRRLGAAVVSFDFPGNRYLQVGDNEGGVYANDNGLIYLVGGSNANAKLNFYRGTGLAARLETQGGANLALVVNESTKTLTDATYHRIQNSVLWVSTGYNTTPSIYVSSSLGNVGIGTSIMEPNWKLTVDGNIRIARNGSGVLFPDGTSLVTGNLGALSVGNVSNNDNAVIQSNADLIGGGDVILRAGSLDGLVLNTGGYVGIGTLSPVSKLNLRGGDLVLGTPYNPYGADSVEDLVVGGNIAFDGELVQRSALQVKFSELLVAHNVYLSTNTAFKTGIGTLFPKTSLDVNGNAQFGSGVTKSTFTAAGALQLASPLGVAYGGAGASLSGVVTGGILYKSAATTVGGSAALIGVLKGNDTGAPTAMTGSLGYNTYWSDANTIAAEQYTALSRGGSNADLSGVAQGSIIYKGAAALAASGSLTGVLKGNGTGAPTAMNGADNAIAYWSDANTIDDSTILSHNGARLLVSGAADFTGSVTSASSGTFNAAGLNVYSIVTSSGIRIAAGRLAMSEGAANNYILVSNSQGIARWADPASGSFGDGWVGNEITNVTNATLTRSGLGTSVSPYEVALNLGNANTWTGAQTFNGGATMGNTLAVGANNITMTGSLGTTGSRLTAGWFTDLTVSNTISGSVNGNAGTVTNGVYNNGTYANPAWITSLAGAKITGNISGNAGTATALAANGGNCTLPDVALGVNESGIAECAQPTSITGNAATVSNGVYNNGTYANPAWITSLAGSKISGNISGDAANVTGTVAVGNGGTGRTTLTAGRVLVGNDASAVSLVNGLTVDVIVKGSAGANCTLNFTNGILTGEDCP